MPRILLTSMSLAIIISSSSIWVWSLWCSCVSFISHNLFSRLVTCGTPFIAAPAAESFGSWFNLHNIGMLSGGEISWGSSWFYSSTVSIPFMSFSPCSCLVCICLNGSSTVSSLPWSPTSTLGQKGHGWLSFDSMKNTFLDTVYVACLGVITLVCFGIPWVSHQYPFYWLVANLRESFRLV